MFNTQDLIQFLKLGQSLCDIRLGQNKNDVTAKFGTLVESYGDKKGNYGYLEIPKGIRYSYHGDEIDGLAILNKREDAIFELFVNEIDATYKIGPETTIQEAIKFLVWAQIKWTIPKTDDKFHLTIKTEANVGLVFDLDDGALMKISITNID